MSQQKEPILTYNGMTIEEMIQGINYIVTTRGKMVKVDLGATSPNRYVYITKLRLLHSPNGLHDEALVEDGFPHCRFLGGDVEAIYRQASEDHRNEQYIYVRAATHEEWREHNARWECAMVDNPHRYGYVTLEEALERSGYSTWNDLADKLYALHEKDSRLLIDNPEKLSTSTASLGAIGSDGKKHIIVHEEWLQALKRRK